MKNPAKINTEMNFSVYPNPAKDQLTVEIEAAEEESNFEIILTDMMGKEVMKLLPPTNVGKNNFKQTFDISTLPSGLYNYQIKSGSLKKTGIISKN